MSSDDSSRQILLEQYKVYIDKMNQVSEQRKNNSNFYITLLSGMLVILAFIVSNNLYLEILHLILVCIALFGIALCIAWYFQIRSHKQLFNVKYSIIKEIEKKLEFPIHDTELRELERQKLFFSLLGVESIVPVLLGIAYVILFIISIYFIFICPVHIAGNLCNLTIIK